MLENNVKPYVEGPTLLIFDTFRAHLTDEVKDWLKENKIDWELIPPNLTSKLQPLDVNVNHPFKSLMQKNWREWLIAELDKEPEEALKVLQETEKENFTEAETSKSDPDSDSEYNSQEEEGPNKPKLTKAKPKKKSPYLKPPSHEQIIQWVEKSWEDIRPTIIEHAFKYTGIVLEEGEEQDWFHGYKK